VDRTPKPPVLYDWRRRDYGNARLHVAGTGARPKKPTRLGHFLRLECVLYEMLTGNRPFHAASSGRDVHASCATDPPEHRSDQTHASRGTCRIVKHCWRSRRTGAFIPYATWPLRSMPLSGTPSQVQALVALPPRRRNWLQLGGAAIALVVIAPENSSAESSARNRRR